MIPYIIFYFYCFLLLFFEKKWIPILFTTAWFIFVGLRDEIGVDYLPVIVSFARNHIDFTDIGAAFRGYMLVDMELVFKFVATIFYYLKIEVFYIHVWVSFVEAIMIYLLLKKIKHKKLLMIYFISLYLLNYPMNVTRNGFAFLLVVFGLNYYRDHKINRTIATVFASLSHYSSIPIILVSSIKIKKIKTIIISCVILVLLFYSFGELIALRYPIDDISGYRFKGYGIKLALGTFLTLSINHFVVRRKFLSQENLFLIALMIVTYLFNPFARYNMFYTYLILFSNLFIIDNRRINNTNLLILLTMPVLGMFGEWLEIYRYEGCPGCGNWLPYRSLLENLF